MTLVMYVNIYTVLAVGIFTCTMACVNAADDLTPLVYYKRIIIFIITIITIIASYAPNWKQLDVSYRFRLFWNWEFALFTATHNSNLIYNHVDQIYCTGEWFSLCTQKMNKTHTHAHTKKLVASSVCFILYLVLRNSSMAIAAGTRVNKLTATSP